MSAPLRICFTAYRGNMHCGGQGIYLWFLARELAALGHEVSVLVGPPHPDPMPFARDVVELPNDRFWGKWFMRDRAAFFPRENPAAVLSPLRFYELAASRMGFFPEPFAFSARAFRAFAQRLRAGALIDVVHDVQCLGWGLLGIRALGVPVVATVHHPLTVDRRASFRRDRTLREALGTAEFHPVGMQAFVARQLDRIITSSRASAHRIQSDFGVALERLRMLGNGIDTELFRPDPAVARDPATLLCVGRSADPNKGIAVLIDALAKLPPPARLVLVDEDHPLHEGRRRAAALGVGDRLEVTGRLAAGELVQRYRRASLVVVPSLYEGFGLPAVEAMACGTPVVAAAAGGLAEVVAACGGGLVVPRGDADALAKGIATLLEQPEARSRLGAEGRAGVQAHYAWRRIAERTAEVYRELRARRGRPASTTTSAHAGARRAPASSA
ncbi:MAG TPA: glycosyltransferase family 4 protein [Myxococcota bacterium]|nr:glycosyltransferase family 4 protein [Myxococcota bacterium]